MRIIAGFLFLWHGSQKLLGFPGGLPEGTPPFVIYGAGSIELIGGIFILVGLFTRWVAFICSGEMAAAYLMAHGTKAYCRLLTMESSLRSIASFSSLLQQRAREYGV